MTKNLQVGSRMVAIIIGKISELRSLCEQFGVAKLELFGSAATGEFDEAKSDLDFLVEFKCLESMNAFDQFFGFQIALEDLYERSIDLVDPTAMRNPYFIESVNRSRELLYVA